MKGKELYLPQAGGTGVMFTIIGSPWALLAIWLIAINVITFVIYGFDKLQAKRKEKKPAVRRVPEKTLLLLAVIGGSIGALCGMKVWRHKTLHKAFKVGVPLILALQITLPFIIYIATTR